MSLCTLIKEAYSVVQTHCRGQMEQNEPLSLVSYPVCKFLISCRSGERLCSMEDCIPGAGTYLRHGSIFASLAGYVLRRNEGEEVRM